MELPNKSSDWRQLLDATLTEIALYAKEICPGAAVEVSAITYEDEDGHIEVSPPPTLPEAEEERVELALASRAAEMFAETGLYILCAVLDPSVR